MLTYAVSLLLLFHLTFCRLCVRTLIWTHHNLSKWIGGREQNRKWGATKKPFALSLLYILCYYHIYKRIELYIRINEMRGCMWYFFYMRACLIYVYTIEWDTKVSTIIQKIDENFEKNYSGHLFLHALESSIFSQRAVTFYLYTSIYRKSTCVLLPQHWRIGPHTFRYNASFCLLCQILSFSTKVLRLGSLVLILVDSMGWNAEYHILSLHNLASGVIIYYMMSTTSMLYGMHNVC